MFWRDAIQKEMYNVGVAFEILETREKAPIGWSKVSGHLVFDIKMSFERKARWVLGLDFGTFVNRVLAI
jgi:hypothetical protein